MDAMRCLSIQLETVRDDRCDPEELLVLVRAAGRYPEVDDVEGDGRFVNLNFFTEDAPLLWMQLQACIDAAPHVRAWLDNVATIVCEGEEGEKEYLLLAHYDDSEILDSL